MEMLDAIYRSSQLGKEVYCGLTTKPNHLRVYGPKICAYREITNA